MINRFSYHPVMTIFLWLWTMSAHSQIPVNTGLILDDDSYQKMVSGGLEKVKDHFIPSSYSLKAYTPFPKSQGNISSCVGWAAGYYAWTMERSVASGITDRVHITDHMAHSAMYIYQQIKRGDHCQSLASISDALNFINQKGDCLESTYPTSTIRCTSQLSADANQEAQKYRNPSSGYKVFGLDAAKDEKIKAVKAHLSAGHPIIVGLSETPPYSSLIGKSYWDIEPALRGGHAMVLIGYSDLSGHFELINSYGSTWGNGGFIKISYPDFAKYCQQAYVLSNTLVTKNILSQPADLQVNLQTNIQVNLQDHQTRIPTPVSFTLHQNHYQSGEKVTAFDPIVVRIAIQKGRCGYLLNIDPQGKTRLIWSMEYPESDTLVTIPEKGWWEFSRPGREIFCLLYGYETLNIDDHFLTQIQTYPGKDVYFKILNSLETQSCPDERILYQDNRIGARATLRSGYEKVFPLFFYLDIQPE